MERSSIRLALAAAALPWIATSCCECGVYVPDRRHATGTADDDCVIVPRPQSTALATLNLEHRQGPIEDTYEFDLYGGQDIVLDGGAEGERFVVEGCRYYVARATKVEDRMHVTVRRRGVSVDAPPMWETWLPTRTPTGHYTVEVESGAQTVDHVHVTGLNADFTLTFRTPDREGAR